MKQSPAITDDRVEPVARAIAAAEWRLDRRLRKLTHSDTAEMYAERSWGLWTDHAKAALEASGLTGGCPADDAALNAELSERDKEVERLREALTVIGSQAICYGMAADETELRDWLKFISETAGAALSTPSRGER